MKKENKEMLLSLIQQHKELGISEQIDYEKFYLYSIITHSTAIEGSTVTEVEAQLLFDEGITAKGKPLIEQLMNLDLKAAYDYVGPVYIRTGRSAVPVFHAEDFKFEIGKGEVVREGGDIAIIANGLMVYEAIQAGEKLAELGINARIINMSTIKPLDEELVLKCAKECGKIITCEEHSVIGGLGEAVCSFLSETYPVPVKRIGVDDEFGFSGPAGEVLKAFGLCADHIVEVAKDFCGK